MSDYRGPIAVIMAFVFVMGVSVILVVDAFDNDEVSDIGSSIVLAVLGGLVGALAGFVARTTDPSRLGRTGGSDHSSRDRL